MTTATQNGTSLSISQLARTFPLAVASWKPSTKIKIKFLSIFKFSRCQNGTGIIPIGVLLHKLPQIRPPDIYYQILQCSIRRAVLTPGEGNKISMICSTLCNHENSITKWQRYMNKIKARQLMNTTWHPEGNCNVVPNFHGKKNLGKEMYWVPASQHQRHLENTSSKPGKRAKKKKNKECHLPMHLRYHYHLSHTDET